MAKDNLDSSRAAASPGKVVDETSTLPAPGPRRSGRARKQTDLFGAQDVVKEATPAKTSPTQPAQTRRNPKRKAAPEVFDVPDDLLEASLGPWDENEKADWPSWTDVESDPAFFNAILSQLGIKGAKIEELMSIDGDSLSQLPEPVYGLVFLCQYVGNDRAGVEELIPNLWFANQTTDSACATIAMLNIMMNADGVALGERLRKFKQESAALSPPLRGNLITNSSWIRVAHNSFARRLDLLNAALSLRNEVDEAKTKMKRSKSTAATASHAAKRRKGKPASDAAFHFIAYVSVGQQVWQLDGLETSPVLVGEVSQGEHWTNVARPVIEARMAAYGEAELSFSLLAVCGDHLAPIRKELAVNIFCLETLESRWSGELGWEPLRGNSPESIDSLDAAELQSYAMDREDAMALCRRDPELSKIQETLRSADADIAAALARRARLVEDQARMRTRYADESTMSTQSDTNGRTKDHTPAIHEWAKKLADHGMLAQLHREAQLQAS